MKKKRKDLIVTVLLAWTPLEAQLFIAIGLLLCSGVGMYQVPSAWSRRNWLQISFWRTWGLSEVPNDLEALIYPSVCKLNRAFHSDDTSGLSSYFLPGFLGWNILRRIALHFMADRCYLSCCCGYIDNPLDMARILIGLFRPVSYLAWAFCLGPGRWQSRSVYSPCTSRGCHQTSSRSPWNTSIVPSPGSHFPCITKLPTPRSDPDHLDFQAVVSQRIFPTFIRSFVVQARNNHASALQAISLRWSYWISKSTSSTVSDSSMKEIFWKQARLTFTSCFSTNRRAKERRFPLPSCVKAPDNSAETYSEWFNSFYLTASRGVAWKKELFVCYTGGFTHESRTPLTRTKIPGIFWKFWRLVWASIARASPELRGLWEMSYCHLVVSCEQRCTSKAPPVELEFLLFSSR